MPLPSGYTLSNSRQDMYKFGEIKTSKTDPHSSEIEKSNSILQCLIFLVKSQGVKPAVGFLRCTSFIKGRKKISYNNDSQ